MKQILVSGVSRGIGQATAELLLAKGYKVYGTYNKNEQAARQLEEKHEGLTVYQVDLGNLSEIAALAEKLKGVMLDGIVNAAGVFINIDFIQLEQEDFEKTFRVNAFAPVYLVQGLQANLNDGASIVNVASTDAFLGSIVGIAYSASKAALLNATQSLANILASRKIRVNAIAPGWIGDGMQAPEQLLKIAADYNPLKRTASYNEVAEVIDFLLSEKASYINGTTITVDGGDMATNYILQKEAELS
jgi:3-oxoacyl-[acyl-carrier protein] reductase